MSAGDVELVCFDLGRVLIRICDGWRDACAVAGIGADPAELDAAQKLSLWELVLRSERGEIGLEEFAAGAAPILGLKPADVCALSDAYLRGPFPGALELLEELRARGMKTACLSNTNANHWRMMMDRGCDNYCALDRLTYRFASHLAGMRKPEDRIYAHVESETRVSGERIVFFDDIMENVEAAQRRGWQAIVIAQDGDPIAQAREHLMRLGVLPGSRPLPTRRDPE